MCSGFFYVVNFGFSQEEVDRQFAIGAELFKLPLDEKLKYRAELEKGGYNGYKPLGLRVRESLSFPTSPTWQNEVRAKWNSNVGGSSRCQGQRRTVQRAKATARI